MPKISSQYTSKGSGTHYQPLPVKELTQKQQLAAKTSRTFTKTSSEEYSIEKSPSLQNRAHLAPGTTVVKLLEAVKNDKELSIDKNGDLNKASFFVFPWEIKPNQKKMIEAFGAMVELIGCAEFSSLEKIRLLNEFCCSTWPKALIVKQKSEVIEALSSHLSLGLSPQEIELFVDRLLFDYHFLNVLDLDDKDDIWLSLMGSTLALPSDEDFSAKSESLSRICKKMIQSKMFSYYSTKIEKKILEKGPRSLQILVDEISYEDQKDDSSGSLLEEMYENADGRFRVNLVVAQSPSFQCQEEVAMKIGKNKVFSISQFSKQKIKELNSKRQGLSYTLKETSDEQDIADKNWIAAERQVYAWAKRHPRRMLKIKDICKINELLCKKLHNNGGNPGSLRKKGEDVSAGWWSYIEGEFVEEEIGRFEEWLDCEMSLCDKRKQNPIVVAAKAYQRLVSIHPFMDGNGRTTRMVMDYILQCYGMPPATLSDSKVAIFGEKQYRDNINADQAILLVKDGVENSCALLGITSPFTNT